MHYFCSSAFFFNATATTEIYTLSLHDALPIFDKGFVRRRPYGKPREIKCSEQWRRFDTLGEPPGIRRPRGVAPSLDGRRSEEHTSELQSRRDLVCRLLLEKKKKKTNTTLYSTL